jgi:hypothetical protein
MTVDLEDLMPWRHGMECRMATLEVASDMHAAKISDHEGLLTVMDKDVSDAQAAFRAQLAVLNSVRVTQTEHDTKFRKLDNRLTSVEARLTSVEGKLTEVHVGIETIIGLLDRNRNSGGEGEQS